MADLYLKRLEAERKRLWAACRLKGLAKETPERQRIAELDRLIQDHKAKKPSEEPTAKGSCAGSSEASRRRRPLLGPSGIP
jgi:hypothetical protein